MLTTDPVSHIPVGDDCENETMIGIQKDSVPWGIDGPSLAAAAAGLMLLPSNASRLVRLHRLAALGMALNDTGAPPVSPNAVRSILKREDISGRRILMQEDPYSEGRTSYQLARASTPSLTWRTSSMPPSVSDGCRTIYEVQPAN